MRVVILRGLRSVSAGGSAAQNGWSEAAQKLKLQHVIQFFREITDIRSSGHRAVPGVIGCFLNYRQFRSCGLLDNKLT